MAGSLEELIVKLEDPLRTSTGHKTIRVERGACEWLDISLRRTIRVPDNGSAYDLPPDCGPFPIYSTNDYKSQLPETMSSKGGVFIPIYQREAMWIKFSASTFFAVKIFVSGLNAISGDPAIETMDQILRRKTKLAEGKSLQDYVVPPSQVWLDGISTADGRVMQFVAVPMGSGYSVEAQLTGHDTVAGLQFEIMPMRRVETHIGFQDLDGKIVVFKISPRTTVAHIVQYLADKKCFSPRTVRVLFDGNTVHNWHVPILSQGIEDQDILELYVERFGGGNGWSPEERASQRQEELREERRTRAALESAELAVSPGGLIKQTIIRDPIETENWDTEKTILFNLQLLNATSFEQLLGIKAPATPITASLYKSYGYPFFKLYEEPSGIKGNFKGIKSVGQLDKKRGIKRPHDEEENLRFASVPIIQLSNVDKRAPFRPVAELEAELKKLNIASEVGESE